MRFLLHFFQLVVTFIWLRSIVNVVNFSPMGYKGYTYLYAWYVGTVLVFLSGMLTRFMVHYTEIHWGTIRMFQYCHEILSVLTLTVAWHMYLCFFMLNNLDHSYWWVNTNLISSIGFDLYRFVARPERTQHLLKLNMKILFRCHLFIIARSTGNLLLGLLGGLAAMMALLEHASRIIININVPFLFRDQLNEMSLMFMGLASYIFSLAIYAAVPLLPVANSQWWVALENDLSNDTLVNVSTTRQYRA